MHTMIHTSTTNDISGSRRIAKSQFRDPHYECRYHDDAMKLTVYIPGVVASGVDITMRGPELTITARKERFVRPNWNGLQLERAQRDYLLRLRIGYAYDPSDMTAELHNGMLTLTLRRRDTIPERSASPLAAAV